MPILGILTFCFTFFAVSRTLLQPNQNIEQSGNSSSHLQIELPNDLNLEDLEGVITVLNNFQQTKVEK